MPRISVGLLLLTGGASRRFGAPKHLQGHPDGGSWASHLLSVFHEALGQGPVRVLGAGLPGHPELAVLEDAGLGPAPALASWAKAERSDCLRWWIAPCDQVRWTVRSLADWHGLAALADPHGEAWVAAHVRERAQPLGGFLGSALLPSLGASSSNRIQGLWEELPHLLLPWEGKDFDDVDDPASFASWQEDRNQAP